MKSLKSKLYAGGAIAGSMFAAGSAMAADAGIDVSSVSSTIADCVTAAATIGVAVLALHFGIKAYKWIKGAG